MKLLKKVWMNWASSRKDKIQLIGNSDSTSQKIGLVCPKCSCELYSPSGRSTGIQLYVCRKCAYQGSLGLKKNQMPYKNMPLW